MFNKLACSVITAALLSSRAAVAADLPGRNKAPAAPVVYAPAFTWTASMSASTPATASGESRRLASTSRTPGHRGWRAGRLQLPVRAESGARPRSRPPVRRPARGGERAGPRGGAQRLARRTSCGWFGTVRPASATRSTVRCSTSPAVWPTAPEALAFPASAPAAPRMSATRWAAASNTPSPTTSPARSKASTSTSRTATTWRRRRSPPSPVRSSAWCAPA